MSRFVDDMFQTFSGWLGKQVGADEAEDLLAETLARGWYARRRFHDPGTGSAGAWLQGIAQNVVREYRRRSATELRARQRLGLFLVADRSLEEDADVRLAAFAAFATVAPALGRLPDEQRSALELRVVQELDYSEIAAKQGISIATARTRVHRTLRNLRVEINGGTE